MRPVTKPGPQPPSCCVEDCERSPAGPGEVMCAGHLKLTRQQNGSGLPGQSNAPPIVQPDDPAVLERAAKKAELQEQQEYAERRRVKTWKTLPNGSRVPDEYWTEEELAALDAEEEAAVSQLAERIRALPTNMVDPDEVMRSGQENIHRAFALSPVDPWRKQEPEDPTKAQAKFFRKALRGKLGPTAQAFAESALRTLGDIAE